MRRPHEIICRGIKYKTLKEFANTFGMNPGTVQTRLRAGMTPEEVITKEVRSSKRAYKPCVPTDYNCLHCTKPDCTCSLPPQVGETASGDILRKILDNTEITPERTYRLLLDTKI